ncbi:hypothetical protein [Corallococcus silvisoli]|uniref:hypothetical protein n=1 Tax=Corallococcus silvisoli TaxID=2697031 RepID=UPI0013767FB0|nr:hypothetical protein [Corallococcus silvisoli]NBD12870.1 hypothetical protein [Corallococcus silvisoli]
MNYDAVIASVREDVRQGLSVEKAVVALHDAGLTIVQSIKALIELYGMPLNDAKSAAASHPVWGRVVKAAEPLHDELEAYADRLKNR